MGPAGKYNRVQPAPPSDSVDAREAWFAECLVAVGKLKLPSLAFPHEIGCGLAGGHWPAYHAMLKDFASAHPETEVFICRWGGGHGSGGRGRGGGGKGGGAGGRGGAGAPRAR